VAIKVESSPPENEIATLSSSVFSTELDKSEDNSRIIEYTICSELF